MSVTYIRPESTTARRRKTKIGTEIAHDTCDSDTTFNVCAVYVAAFQLDSALF